MTGLDPGVVPGSADARSVESWLDVGEGELLGKRFKPGKNGTTSSPKAENLLLENCF